MYFCLCDSVKRDGLLMIVSHIGLNSVCYRVHCVFYKRNMANCKLDVSILIWSAIQGAMTIPTILALLHGIATKDIKIYSILFAEAVLRTIVSTFITSYLNLLVCGSSYMGYLVSLLWVCITWTWIKRYSDF